LIEVKALLGEVGIETSRHSIRDQYDTYFFFDEVETSRLRFREDQVRHEDGALRDTFYTLTLMGPIAEKEFENSILLTRARYTASASQSLRFYREYFNPSAEQEVVKHRRRCHITYKETEFAINLDQLSGLNGQVYLEIKSRTWSAKDAVQKAELISELLALFGAKQENQFKVEYVDMARQA
jgi:5-methylthioadenosine/S-adenosylhomocysteine deaminase